MNWWIMSGGLCVVTPEGERNPTEGYVPFDRFEELTGKKINWIVRKNKYIFTTRKKGHLKIYDRKFIEGETYKNNNRTYKCEHVNEDGLALLTPTRGNALKAITARDTTDWEIE